MRFAHVPAVVIGSLLLVFALAGCVADAPEPLTHDQVREMGMPAEQKRADLPPGFPVQVPVVAGEVVAASEFDQGDGVWLYDLRTDYEWASVAEWYRRTYPIANWQLLSELTSAAGDAATLEFVKGAARSTVVVRSEPEGTLVEATVSLDAPASDVF